MHWRVESAQADGATIIREGHGTGEGHGTSPGEVHDIALKAAETDATKRALATFGRPFGLELYRSAGRNKATIGIATRPLPAPAAIGANQTRLVPDQQQQATPTANEHGVAGVRRAGIPPDDTTPIPRPSRYYGRRQDVVTRDRAQGRRELQGRPAVGTSIIVPTSPALVPGPIDKSLLTIAEPKRLRDKAHLRFVASQPCLVCGRQPSDPHHLRFAQPRALGLKVSDEFTVPLCRGHHRELHQAGNELAWWERLKLKPLETAKTLWGETHPASADAPLQPAAVTAPLQPAAPEVVSPDQAPVRQTIGHADQLREPTNSGSIESDDAVEAPDAS